MLLVSCALKWPQLRMLWEIDVDCKERTFETLYKKWFGVKFLWEGGDSLFYGPIFSINWFKEVSDSIYLRNKLKEIQCWEIWHLNLKELERHFRQSKTAVQHLNRILKRNWCPLVTRKNGSQSMRLCTLTADLPKGLQGKTWLVRSGRTGLKSQVFGGGSKACAHYSMSLRAAWTI